MRYSQLDRFFESAAFRSRGLQEQRHLRPLIAGKLHLTLAAGTGARRKISLRDALVHNDNVQLQSIDELVQTSLVESRRRRIIEEAAGPSQCAKYAGAARQRPQEMLDLFQTELTGARELE